MTPSTLAMDTTTDNTQPEASSRLTVSHTPETNDSTHVLGMTVDTNLPHGSSDSTERHTPDVGDSTHGMDTTANATPLEDSSGPTEPSAPDVPPTTLIPRRGPRLPKPSRPVDPRLHLSFLVRAVTRPRLSAAELAQETPSAAAQSTEIKLVGFQNLTILNPLQHLPFRHTRTLDFFTHVELSEDQIMRFGATFPKVQIIRLAGAGGDRVCSMLPRIVVLVGSAVPPLFVRPPLAAGGPPVIRPNPFKLVYHINCWAPTPVVDHIGRWMSVKEVVVVFNIAYMDRGFVPKMGILARLQHFVKSIREQKFSAVANVPITVVGLDETLAHFHDYDAQLLQLHSHWPYEYPWPGGGPRHTRAFQTLEEELGFESQLLDEMEASGVTRTSVTDYRETLPAWEADVELSMGWKP